MNAKKPPAEEVREAQLIVAHIDDLESSDSFRWLKGLIEARIENLELDILDNDDLSHQERENLRQQRKGMQEILERPKIDRQAQVGYLARYGINPGDIPG